MSKWLKKKLEQLSAKLNADDETINNLEREAQFQEIKNIPATEENKGPKPVQKKDRLQNVEELKEVIMGAITNSVRMLGYSKSVIAGLTFHSAFADNAVENIGLASLVKDADFAKRIRRDFKSRGINYKEDFPVHIIYQSPKVSDVTRIIDGIGIEVLTPGESLKKIFAKLVATEGITWEPEYKLEPTGKNYFIGRCKDPKIDNGPKIHNDIAFVGIEEINEEKYKINNHISRSHARIVFDADMGAYKIYRSKFLNNPSHKIKIYNAGLNDFNGVSLNQSTVPHVLKNGDSICFNDTIILEFYITD